MDSIKAVTILAVLLLAPSAAWATDYCVRAGANGTNDGSNWTNAFSQLPATLMRGSVYYVADGDYPKYMVDDLVSGALTITIKKATAVSHGINDGWNDTYGDGQAIFAFPFNVVVSYVNFDGSVGSGSDPSTYGFKVAPGDCTGIFTTYTPTTGSRIGVITGLAETVLTDSTQKWTTNNLQSKFVKVTRGSIVKHYVIRSNTATTLTVALCNTMQKDGFQAGDSYELLGTNGIQLIGAPGIGYATRAISNVGIFHVALVNCGEQYKAYPQVGIYSNPQSGTQMNFSNNYFSDSSTSILTRAWSGTIANNYFNSNYTGCDWEAHGQHLSTHGDNVDVYSNVFKDFTPYAIMIHCHVDSVCVPGSSNWNVYNNVFVGGSNVDALFSSVATTTVDNVVMKSNFHHNTIVGVTMGGKGVMTTGPLSDPSADKNYAYNNLFYGCANPDFDNYTYGSASIMHEYNAYFDCSGSFDSSEGGTAQTESGSPFVNQAAGDYRLALHTRAGKALTSPFDTDIAGRIRSVDGFWDRGAYALKGPENPKGLIAK